jgi:NTP pyrophosphatase (non-canonical NTP hydrolase)
VATTGTNQWTSEEIHEATAELAASPFLGEMMRELAKAEQKHAPMQSLHEGYAVLLEEVDEFWEEVKKQREARDHANVRKELAQIAAMAWRIVLNLYEQKGQ